MSLLSEVLELFFMNLKSFLFVSSKIKGRFYIICIDVVITNDHYIKIMCNLGYFELPDRCENKHIACNFFAHVWAYNYCQPCSTPCTLFVE